MGDNWNVEKGQDANRISIFEKFKQVHTENILHRFKKTSFPKEADAKAITLQTNAIFAFSQVMSSHLRLKSIMSNHRRNDEV